MAIAIRDANHRPSMVFASSADGSTPVVPKVNSSTHALFMSIGSGGADHGRATAARDGDFVPVAMGVSSTDGTTPVEIYANAATGEILARSN